MPSQRSRFVPGFAPATEALESRVVLSAAGLAHTATTLAVQAGTLGQPIQFAATVRGPASAGSPAGTVEFLDHGAVLGTAAVSAGSTTGKFATSQATYTLTPQPGGPATFFGKHSITAEFVPSTGFAKSAGSKAFTVAQPTYTTLSDGAKYATIVPGSGPAITAGQTANVLYTGYLAKNGAIFDDSADHGGTPFSFTVGGGQVIPGFDAGTVGMKAGETRIVEIPAAEGYGSTADGAIPANSALIFVLTLSSIS
jgi:FKBP-type peptidyl-prolyl cis-trans isomerase FkpA